MKIKSIVFIAVIAVIGLGFFTTCEQSFLTDGDPTYLTITGLSAYNGKYASGALLDPNANKQSAKKGSNMAICMPKLISGGKVEWEAIKTDYTPASINGAALVVISISTTAALLPDNAEVDKYVVAPSIKAGANSLDFINDGWQDLPTQLPQ